MRKRSTSKSARLDAWVSLEDADGNSTARQLVRFEPGLGGLFWNVSPLDFQCGLARPVRFRAWCSESDPHPMSGGDTDWGDEPEADYTRRLRDGSATVHIPSGNMGLLILMDRQE